MTAILGIDTSTTHVGVALGVGGEVVAGTSEPAERRHAEMLVPAIDALLREAGVRPADLDALAVGIGPGLFTGLRVGVTTAMVMGRALDVPVVPVPTLDLLARPHEGDGRTIAAVVDAKRREVFCATYSSGAGGLVRLSDDAVGPARGFADALDALGRDVLVVGDGAAAHPDAFADRSRCELAGPHHAVPDPSTLVRHAFVDLAAGRGLDADAVRPRYLRKSDAELNWDRARR
ncbi:MAG: hypothetical protein RL531_592 [Actinomycetota bacterium]